jgi:hypothetical protein
MFFAQQLRAEAKTPSKYIDGRTAQHLRQGFWDWQKTLQRLAMGLGVAMNGRRKVWWPKLIYCLAFWFQLALSGASHRLGGGNLVGGPSRSKSALPIPTTMCWVGTTHPVDVGRSSCAARHQMFDVLRRRNTSTPVAKSAYHYGAIDPKPSGRLSLFRAGWPCQGHLALR